MKIMKLAVVVAAVGLCQSQAFALENSAVVKVSTVLKAQNTWNGQPISYPDGKAEVTGLVVEIAPGGETGWHLHPVPSFAMVLDGDLEVQLKSGESKRLHAGDALAEVVNTAHNGRNIGSGPVRLVVFYAGAIGSKLTEKEGQ